MYPLQLLIGLLEPLGRFDWPEQNKGSKGGAVVRVLASSHCGHSIPGSDAIRGLSLKLGSPVFSSPQKPTNAKSTSIRHDNGRQRTIWCKCCHEIVMYFLLFPLFLAVIDLNGNRPI